MSPTPQPLSEPPTPASPAPQSPQFRDRYWLHALLFLLTLVTTSMAGAEFLTNNHWIPWFASGPQDQLGWADLWKGLPYAIPFLLFLACHEFGHYFTARWHRVRCSLPYFIPVFLPIFINIGTFGAVIRIREQPKSTKEYFDIGIAGPLAGFVISVGVLIYGFLTLPELDYLLQMNPDYIDQYGGVPTREQLLRDAPAGLIEIGNSLIFWLFEQTLADPSRMPNHLELFHYPFLFSGYITLFFTALNLLPIGQLDGGHVTYGLFGRRVAGTISRVFILGLITYGGLGLLDFGYAQWPIVMGFYLLYLFAVVPKLVGNDLRTAALVILGIMAAQQGIQAVAGPIQLNLLWLVYAFLATRVIRADHPPAPVEQPLDRPRKLLGWVAIAVFILCFSPRPLHLARPEAPPADREGTITVHAAPETQGPASRVPVVAPAYGPASTAFNPSAMPQWHKAETFEDYLAAKRIDSAAWQAARPEEYAEIQQLFATLGPRNFDQQKKFQINEWRLAFPALKPSDRQPPPKDSGQEKTTEQQA